MYIVKYLELVHMADMAQARASSPYELVSNILRYTFNNLYISDNHESSSLTLNRLAMNAG